MISDIDLALLLCPKRFGMLNDRERDFWLSRARIAKAEVIRSTRFRRAVVLGLTALTSRFSRSQNRGDGQTCPPVRLGKVRLHPLPEGASLPLASIIGAAVAGAIRNCLNAHPLSLTNAQKGLIIGSSRKRAVNQLVCAEGEARLRMALGEKQS